MKVAVIFTGGTIGSQVRDGKIGPGEDRHYMLLERYREKASHTHIDFSVFQPFTMLSENSTGGSVSELVRWVKQCLTGEYEGIIITHGTDTLAYSASALGYVFSGVTIPIVLVSSNYVLTDPRANGVDNFYYGVDWICQKPGGGVFVSYKNEGDNPKIHLGTRILGHRSFSDDVYSVMDRYLGEYDKEKESWYMKENPPKESGQLFIKEPVLQQTSPIQQIVPYVGMAYPKLETSTKAVLHHTYHAGTICNESQGAQYFFQEARKRDIPVFVTGLDASMLYESTKIYEQYGMIPLSVASPVAMYMKLWLLIEAGVDLEYWMRKQIAGDILETKEVEEK